MTTVEESPAAAGTPGAGTSRQSRGERRAELAAFLRARRSRITPTDVGLPPGLRRRTPGLRREEVAQLAGVGVTWYTWLEQGRPIHVSAHVLNAVARTLRLDEAEREHLHQLAGTPPVPADPPLAAVPPAVREILTALNPLPACLLNSRYDLLAGNEAYRTMFAQWHTVPCTCRNVLWCCFIEPTARERFVNLDEALPHMVATLRASFADHLGEPAWVEFIRQLAAASPEFAALWARHDVARPQASRKQFLDPVAGLLNMCATSLSVAGMPETRIAVYTPTDDETRARLPLVVGADPTAPLPPAAGPTGPSGRTW